MILIPFRNSMQHAFSLLRQHRRVVDLRAKNKFTLSSMTWLGHHEFGLDHQPYQFYRKASAQYSNHDLDYWLQLWCQTYAWLEYAKSDTAVFVCYEDLCKSEENWDHLAALGNIAVEHRTGDRFRLSNKPVDVESDQCLADNAAAIYELLVLKARSQVIGVG